ncbi:MAG: glycine cleavage system aminomethyltransferase GcvT [Opitutales bacterium]|jgi:aminomethyltransferase
MSAPLSRTPLFALHVELGGRIVPFAGWEMPVQYTGIIEEHMAVRQTAGLFDVSHMGEARVRGRDAAKFLDGVMTNEMGTIKVGMARYTVMCQPDGGCVDDLIVYRLADDEFLICLNASNAPKDIAWMRAHIGAHQVEVLDECSAWAQLALQGPRAEAILALATATPLASIKRFGFVFGEVAGVTGCLISRTGYTGSPGFEIYLPAASAEKVARALLAAGKPHGLVPAGLGARDSLRLEANYPLYGHEISEQISPIQAGLGWTVKFTKPEFIGREALHRQAQGGPVSSVVLFSLDDRRIARQGAVVYSGETPVGEVLSGTQSPVLGKPIGTALVAAGHAASATLTVDIRGHRIPLRLSAEPFVK